MDILHVFDIYQKQQKTLRQNDHFGRPQILRQFRKAFIEFTITDIEILKGFLLDNETKWFVADLLNNLDSFPGELLLPMLSAAVSEPNPSFNNEFIKPCRRVFDYAAIQNILIQLFHDGDDLQKIGVLQALYWARPTFYVQTI